MYPDAEAKSRFEFVNDLTLSLAIEFLLKRLEIPNLPLQLKKILLEAARVEEKSPDGKDEKEKSDKLVNRKLCRYCPYPKNRATAYKCVKCDVPTCLEHSKTTLQSLCECTHSFFLILPN